jgi:ribonuclease R
MNDIPDSSEEFEGYVVGHRDGHGFIARTDGQADVFLTPNDMRAVLHKDKVKAMITRLDRKGRPEGRVTEIIERAETKVIGRLLKEGSVWLVAPEDKRYGHDILIPAAAIGSATVGQVVVAELTEPPALFGQPVGRVAEVLGDLNDPGLEIEIAVRKFNVPHLFSEACEAATRKLPDVVRLIDKKGRVDLTDVPLVTIDGEDARDFDDAVYCEPTKIGRGKGWRLLVAIADVSHYVQNDSAIDKDAYERATSVYFPRRVIPMLPEKLSNGLCSLNPHVERLCMVCDMVVNDKGEVTAYQFYPAVMLSHARLTYTEVAAALANSRGREAERHADQMPNLLNLHDVYKALLQARGERGAIDFETQETQIICDPNGKIERIEARVRNVAHRLIEEAMLAANVCCAEFVGLNKHPGLFRVHEGPTPEKLALLNNYLKAVGIPRSLGDPAKPSDLQRIAQESKERPDVTQVHSMLLRSMQQAVYTPHNNGHFGLAYSAYAHFTSPIRRYPDLLIHRVIKAILADKRYNLAVGHTFTPDPAMVRRLHAKKKPVEAQEGGPKLSKTALKELTQWEAAGAHCSANERRADEASRDVEAWLKCTYMKDRLGEEFTGIVSAVTSFGLFVMLEGVNVEGLVHITELGADYFRFDEARQELRGERTGIRYAIGSRLVVQVSRVDLDARRIDFTPVKDDLTLMRQRASAAEAKATQGGQPTDPWGSVPSAAARSGSPHLGSNAAKVGKGAKGAKGAKATQAARPSKAGKAGKFSTNHGVVNAVNNGTAKPAKRGSAAKAGLGASLLAVPSGHKLPGVANAKAKKAKGQKKN